MSQIPIRVQLHKDKTVIFPVTEGIPFLGYRVFPDHRRLAKQNVKVMERRLLRMHDAFEAGTLSTEKITERIRCWINHAEHADTYLLRERLFMNFPFSRPSESDDEG